MTKGIEGKLKWHLRCYVSTKKMKTINQNPAIESILEKSVGEEVLITCHSPIQFSYSGTLDRHVGITNSGLWIISRPGSPEITFQTEAIKSIYTNPFDKVSIYIN